MKLYVKWLHIYPTEEHVDSSLTRIEVEKANSWVYVPASNIGDVVVFATWFDKGMITANQKFYCVLDPEATTSYSNYIYIT